MNPPHLITSSTCQYAISADQLLKKGFEGGYGELRLLSDNTLTLVLLDKDNTVQSTVFSFPLSSIKQIADEGAAIDIHTETNTYLVSFTERLSTAKMLLIGGYYTMYKSRNGFKERNKWLALFEKANVPVDRIDIVGSKSFDVIMKIIIIGFVVAVLAVGGWVLVKAFANQ